MRPAVTLALILATATVAACGLLPDEPLEPLARTCGQWQELEIAAQVTTAEALVADRLEAARSVQQLPADATRAEIVGAARSSIDKVCELGRRPARPLAGVVAALYGT